jgi:2-keto-4-pentenoate hydratase
MTSALKALAERQLRDYRARQPGTCFADPGHGLGLPQAYALQQAVAALRVAAGDRVIGYKVGCTGPGTVEQFGMEGPIRGQLFDSEVRQTGTTLNADDFARLAIEGEMALRIGDDGEIAAAFPIIELHHFVFRAPLKTLVELVANNGLNGGVVLPDAIWHALPDALSSDATMSVRINGELRGSGALWPLPGGPSASLDWLRGHLADFGMSLLPSQIVLAGTPLGLYAVDPGDHVVVSLDGVPAVDCLIV